jgi:extracellular matrix protein 14
MESLKGYEDQVVIRFNISNAQQEAALRTVVDRMLLDVWDFANNHVDIRLPSRRVRYLTRALPSTLQENHAILIPDLARAAAATYPSNRRLTDRHQPYSRGTTLTNDGLPKKQDAIDVFFQDYQPYSVMVAWMRLIDSMFRGRGLVQMISIGKSYEGRDIPALRVGIRPSEDTPSRRREVVLVTGGIHAREWIATSSVSYVAWSFIQSIDKDPMINKILERFDIVFIPVLNPDGYEYTWEVDRLWRKSRQRTKMAYCQGFDLDHSFSYKWDSVEHQTEPCSESYGGDEPFQAVEAAQFADWARNETAYGSKFVGYLDLHSYSQQVLVPYSFSCDVDPPNMENLEEVAMNLAKHMRLSNGEVYTVASACEGAVSPATKSAGPLVEARGGSAVDYIYHELGAHYSYQIKLRDTGSYGFLLPSDHIIPTGEEVFQAMKYLGDYCEYCLESILLLSLHL